MTANWYLIHTKPRQEQIALENLQNQDYPCFLPLIRVEKVRRGKLNLVDEPLFARYLFVQLDTSIESRSWTPIHSTKGVTRLVRFGMQLAKVDTGVIDFLREQVALANAEPQRLFQPGDRVRVADGPFAGLEGVFHMRDGEMRALVLIELLSRPVALRIDPAALKPVH
ncbi:MAG: putative transcriptional activator [Pseudomonadota bacterium]|jgi:transcriptional antiterminator RfaH